MQTIPTSNQIPISGIEMSDWFDKLLETINNEVRFDQFTLEENIASNSKQKFYSNLMSGNVDELLTNTRKETSKVLIQKMLLEFLSEINRRKISLSKLAFDLSDSKILVWAEVAEDDRKSMNEIFLAEAAVNHTYYEKGFHVSSTVVEDEDKIEVPPHYKTLSKTI